MAGRARGFALQSKTLLIPAVLPCFLISDAKYGLSGHIMIFGIVAGELKGSVWFGRCRFLGAEMTTQSRVCRRLRDSIGISARPANKTDRTPSLIAHAPFCSLFHHQAPSSTHIIKVVPALSLLTIFSPDLFTLAIRTMHVTNAGADSVAV